jgi:TolB-like protein/AraC-like DNA-binding protein
MIGPNSMDQAFIRRLTDIVLANLANENFGAEELAKEAGMSRANLYRRLRSVKQQDIIQLIREIRLQRAKEMLLNNEGTISEISYKVGFGSPAYFTRCFHEFYGYTPGEIRRKETGNKGSGQPETISEVSEDNKDNSGIAGSNNRNSQGFKKILIIVTVLITALILIGLFYFLAIKNSEIPVKSGLQDPAKSIVIIPFKNLSDNPENQWFVDGITEDVLNQLFRIRELRVISRTTSEYLSGKALTSSEIARKLNVNYVLEGSILRDENRVRIFVQLIDARNDRHLYSERFENEMTGIFEIQSDIAIKVADKLQAIITSKERGQIYREPTKNTEAYNCYLQGRFFLNRRTGEGFIKSIGYFERAIAADPEYALAWAGLADAYYLISFWKELPVLDPDSYIKAKNYALKALELDSNLAEAHTVLGGLLTWYDWNWEEARKELKLAVELNPSFSFGHFYYYELLNILGESKKAREQLNIALQLDPFVPIFHIQSGWSFYNEGKYGESVEEFQKVIELDPFINVYMGIFKCYEMLEDSTKALDALSKALETNNIFVTSPYLLTDIYRRSGMNGIWNWLIETEFKKSRPSSWDLTFWFLRIDKKDRALNMLERLYEEKIFLLPTINNNTDLGIIRSEPRFQAIIKKMGLTDYQKSRPGYH